MSDIWSDFIESLDMSGIIPEDFASFLANEQPEYDSWDDLPDIDVFQYGYSVGQMPGSKMPPDPAELRDNPPEMSFEDAQRKFNDTDIQQAIDSSIYFVKYMIEFADQQEAGLSILLDETKIKMRDEMSSVIREHLLQSKNSEADKLEDIITMAMLMSIEIMQILSLIDDDSDDED